MSELIVYSHNAELKNYKGCDVCIDRITGYVCLSDMARAYKKRVYDWTRLTTTGQFIRSLEGLTGIPASTLLLVAYGSVKTWAHPKVAIQFAQWCSPEFAIQVSTWVEELLTTGKVEIVPIVTEKPLSQMQMISVMALEMDRQNQEIELIKAQQQLESNRIDAVEITLHQHDGEIDRIFSPNGHYFSVIGYARTQGLAIGLQQASELGRLCTSYCKQHDIRIEKLNDPRFGAVGSYPEEVIKMYL